MTKKDFELIAGTFKRSKPLSLDEQNQFERLLNNIMTDLSNENYRFDPDKFLEAIGDYDLRVK